jgi:hypothetical protein
VVIKPCAPFGAQFTAWFAGDQGVQANEPQRKILDYKMKKLRILSKIRMIRKDFAKISSVIVITRNEE